VRNLFLFVGAIRRPAGSKAAASGRSRRLRADRRAGRTERRTGVPPLETTVPAVRGRDVRSGSVKRVGGAIGEGAQVVAALHGFLGDSAKPAL